jgi:catechol 2,3-dioxygenase-like lactoylglutathione lyase family enzyme
VTVELTSDSIDLAIVTNDLPPMLAFYRDVLGFIDNGAAPTRASTGGTVHRLGCGTVGVKLVTYGRGVPDQAAGGVRAATGYRYWTIHVANLDEIVTQCAAAGAPIVVPVKEISVGVRVAIVADPDGNWVEFMCDEKGGVSDADRG